MSLGPEKGKQSSVGILRVLHQLKKDTKVLDPEVTLKIFLYNKKTSIIYTTKQTSLMKGNHLSGKE